LIEDELFYKIKEDSELLDRSMGTNQSERSGSIFSLPGNGEQQTFLGSLENNLEWRPRATPKSSSAVELARLRTFSLAYASKTSEKEQEEQKVANKLRHSNSQVLIPCQPLVIASRIDAIRARNVANQGDVSDTGGEMNSSIHFTIEENSGEMELF